MFENTLGCAQRKMLYRCLCQAPNQKLRRSPLRAPLQLPPRRIVRFWLCSACRLESENCFAFFHQIETIARNRFQIGRVSLEQIDLARLMREQILLFVHLLLQVVDLRTALHQFFVGRDEQTHNNEPDCQNQQHPESSVQSLPHSGFAARAEIGVSLIHLADCSAVYRFVTKFFFNSQQLIVFGDPITAGKRPGFNLTGVRRHCDVGNRNVFRFARAMTDHS